MSHDPFDSREQGAETPPSPAGYLRAVVLADGLDDEALDDALDFVARFVPPEHAHVVLDGDRAAAGLAAVGTPATTTSTNAAPKTQRRVNEDNLILLPRGTASAPALLLPLFDVSLRDPDATLVVLRGAPPREGAAELASAVDRALRATREHPDDVVVLGRVPDGPVVSARWLVVAREDDEHGRRLIALTETSDHLRGAYLLRSGALLDADVLVGRVRSLVRLFDATRPELAEALLPNLPELLDPGPVARRARAAAEALDALPSLDLGRDVLAAAPERLRVVTALGGASAPAGADGADGAATLQPPMARHGPPHANARGGA